MYDNVKLKNKNNLLQIFLGGALDKWLFLIIALFCFCYFFVFGIFLFVQESLFLYIILPIIMSDQNFKSYFCFKLIFIYMKLLFSDSQMVPHLLWPS